MSTERPRRRWLPGPLLLRIYLVGLAQVLLIALSLMGVRRLEDNSFHKRFAGRHPAYFAAEWTRLLNAPTELQEAMIRSRRILPQATVRDLNGGLLGSSAQPALDALSPGHLRQLTQERIVTFDAPPVTAVAMPESGPIEAYAIFMQRPPPPGPPGNPALPIILMLVCTGITSLLFARHLAPPLQRLAKVARAFGSGKLDVRTGLRRRDELGQVAEAFDEMADRITLLLSSQKQLLANVSHELRTPLARIRVALDLAEEGDAQLARESLSDITMDLAELERLLDDVLTAARLDITPEQIPGATPPLRKELMDARTLVDKAAARFSTNRPKHTLDVTLEGTLPVLDADPVLLRRALDNLLDNAGKYSEPGTTVRLSAQATEAGLQLDIIDEGIGIDASDLPHLFTPFFRSDRSRARTTGGVGLGLALARRIITVHGGSLALESQPGQGTSVRVVLPAADPLANEATALPLERSRMP
ncbi:sensor histidine kinase [Stigmatella erecta]|uniref:histidine kinase n=1 Tax=Stigmatella erecta TaxID=83460 RepID=A0A1I0HAC4_9BACT|nr:HAMP domain-containing sensor histidine kinase [Stigmatella erecta]SET80707.1 Signal transduction histidine kinase [Stigmatella erecta]